MNLKIGDPVRIIGGPSSIPKNSEGIIIYISSESNINFPILVYSYCIHDHSLHEHVFSENELELIKEK